MRKVKPILLFAVLCLLSSVLWSCADRLQDRLDDRRLVRDIEMRLINEPWFLDIKVKANHGDVTLTGKVYRSEFVQRAVDIAADVVERSKITVEITVQEEK